MIGVDPLAEISFVPIEAGRITTVMRCVECKALVAYRVDGEEERFPDLEAHRLWHARVAARAGETPGH